MLSPGHLVNRKEWVKGGKTVLNIEKEVYCIPSMQYCVCFTYLCAVGEGFGAGGVAVSHGRGSVLQEAPPWSTQRQSLAFPSIDNQINAARRLINGSASLSWALINLRTL